MDPLRLDLCRLARTLEGSGVRPLLVGGFGLLLKAEFLDARGFETLAPVRFPRATQDLDLVLRSEVVVDAGKMRALQEALEDMGYDPVPGRENYQWRRGVEVAGREESVKVDLLGQIPEDRSRISLRDRRMRPHGFTGLHAHPLTEATFVHQGTRTIPVCGLDGKGLVELPHPFSYMLLKLFAFEDRKHDESVDYGRHHAFDLYRIVAMLTAPEWDQVVEYRAMYAPDPVVEEATRIVRHRFGDLDGLGVIRIQEYAGAAPIPLTDYPAGAFMEHLIELWGL